jgi:hypothetical protein
MTLRLVGGVRELAIAVCAPYRILCIHNGGTLCTVECNLRTSLE